MTFRAVTLLAENTDPLLADLCSHLARTGLDVVVADAADARERRELVENGEVDLVWACGLLTAELIDDGRALDVVAAPVFPGETEPVYRSLIVTRPGAGFRTLDDARAGRLAVNEYGSWSGWHAYVAHLRALGHSVDDHPTQVVSGSHVNSARALLDGAADVAALDSSLWSHLLAHRPDLARIDVLDRTREWPAPPFSLAARLDEQDASGLRGAVLAADWIRPATLESYRPMLERSRIE